MSGLPWDNNSWDIAAQIAADRHRRLVAAVAMQTGTVTDTPLVLKMAADTIPQLMMKTIIIPGDKTKEGVLIAAVALPWFDIIEELAKDPTAAFRIPWRKWEEIVAGAYERAGFDEVTLTPRSGDQGRDVIAVKKGIGIIRIIDQVKAFAPTNLVTADDVSALIGVLHGDGASKGYLTTTSDFAPGIATNPLIQKFIPSQLELVNGSTLLARLKELAKR
jgi:restriction system protein